MTMNEGEQKRTSYKNKAIKGVKKMHNTLMSPKFSFYLALSSGISAIIATIATVISAWSILTFDLASFQSAANQYLSYLYNSSNATALQYGQYLTSVTQSTVLTLRSAFSIFIPLLVISGLFMIIAAFYLRSKDSKKVFSGMIFTIFFSALVFIGIIVYMLIGTATNNPTISTTVAMLFSYLGSYPTSGNPYIVIMYVFFTAYFVLGIISAMVSVYRASKLYG